MTPLADQQDLTVGSMSLRPSTCELVHPAGVETLEPQVMRVLLALARRPGRVLSRDAIVTEAWDGRAVSEDAINRVLSRLRRLSARTGVFRLTTLRKVGYRLDPIPIEGGSAQGSASALTPGRGRTGWIVGLLCLLAVLVAGGGLRVWSERADRTRATVAEGPTLSLSLSAPDPADAAVRSALDLQMRETLSHMQGLRLVAPPPTPAKPTDLVLTGAVGHSGDRPLITLEISDGRSGVRIWSARFDGRTLEDPTAQERAVSAAARFLAIRLGDGLTGPAAAREPLNREAERLVLRARRTYAASNASRHQRDWPRSIRLAREAEAAAVRALEIDPTSAGALMVRYQIDNAPQYPRPGETQAGFQDRLQRAAGFLSRALAADPDDPEVLVAASEDYRQSLRWGDAQRLLERAVAIDPNAPDANTWYAYHLGLVGRCDEGLAHARVAAALAPGDTWRQLAVPRLLHCAGRRAEAAALYRGLQRRDPSNVFLLRELYLMRLGERDAGALRALAAFTRHDLWRDVPPPPLAAQIVRIEAAADALDGRPRTFVRLIEADRSLYAAAPVDARAFGRTQGDAWFVLAFEYGQAGASDRALEALREAVDRGSLYLPWALPYGPTEFPPAVSGTPAYAALWRSSPGLADLMSLRAQAARRPG